MRPLGIVFAIALVALFALLALWAGPCQGADTFAVGSTYTWTPPGTGAVAWTAKLTEYSQRTANLAIVQATFTYSGGPVLVSTFDMAWPLSDAALVAQAQAAIVQYDAIRTEYLFCAASVVGQSVSSGGWSLHCDSVTVNLNSKALLLSVTMSKGSVSRAFVYTLQTRTATLGAVAAEMTAYLQGLVAQVAALEAAPPTDAVAILGVL